MIVIDDLLAEPERWPEARPNRALIYRGHTLHCAAIPPGADLPADPLRGRLSINGFLFGRGDRPA